MITYGDPLSHFGLNIIKDYHRSIEEEISMPLSIPGEDSDIPLIPLPIDGKVGIVGGGIGGLYAAMMLDSLEIPYDIYEATDRVGGRFSTYKFVNGREYDYYDVGAMRFPNTPPMKRMFDLFARLPSVMTGEYILVDENSTLLYYNTFKRRRDLDPSGVFPWNAPGVDDLWSSRGASALLSNSLSPFANALFDDYEHHTDAGWRLMMQYDKYSTRAYMCGSRSDTNPALDKNGWMPYPVAVVDWMEVLEGSTRTFDDGLSGGALSMVAEMSNDEVKWYYINGGAESLTEAMVKSLGVQVKISCPVTSIRHDPEADHIELAFLDGGAQTYSHVINTTTLTCLRSMDITNAGLSIAQHAALNQLTDGPATKIGVRFKTAWWRDTEVMKGYPITGGVSYTDRMVRMVVYPSYGSSATPSTVLMVSYSGTVDALRMGALLQKESEQRLKNLILRDLAEIHDFDPVEGIEFLREQWMEHHGYAWGNDPYVMGSFGSFGPGQFVQSYRSLTCPAANGRLHFAGESVSVRHGWAAGALEASWRAVHAIVLYSFPEKLQEFKDKWGVEAGWSEPIAYRQYAISKGSV